MPVILSIDPDGLRTIETMTICINESCGSISKAAKIECVRHSLCRSLL